MKFLQTPDSPGRLLGVRASGVGPGGLGYWLSSSRILGLSRKNEDGNYNICCNKHHDASDCIRCLKDMPHKS